jgi:tRNA 2-selenouridine synthase
MSISLPIQEFLSAYRLSGCALIDARSEGEFRRGHIPGAVNIPLLNDAARVVVGTTYKQQGRSEAVLKGFELAGPLFHQMILQTRTLAPSNEVMVYCWRGGMRSAVFCWMLNMAGIKTTVLKGGYKSFRNWCLQQFVQPRDVVILGGKTGSGKTEMLNYIKELGEQVLCLETLARHKGSAFGSLGQEPQPTQEHFENGLAFQLGSTDRKKRLWLENESRNVGSVKIPDPLFEMMRKARVVEMNVEKSIREKRILNEYGSFGKDMLAEKTKKLEKRMGRQHVQAALKELYDDNIEQWLAYLLDYYDRTYAYSNELRDSEYHSIIDVKWIDPALEAKELIKSLEVKI